MNVFTKSEIADSYNLYYQTEAGKEVSRIEENLFNSLIKDIPRADMLELGSGTGQWSEFFIKQGFKLTGLEISDEMMKFARAKKLDAKFLKANACTIPFDNNTFETVSSITMLEFVENQDIVIKEAYRVLKPGGWLILGCLNSNSVLGKYKENDVVFKNANFLNPTEWKHKLKDFDNIKMDFGIFYSPNFELLDEKSENEAEPAFIGIIAQKTL